MRAGLAGGGARKDSYTYGPLTCPYWSTGRRYKSGDRGLRPRRAKHALGVGGQGRAPGFSFFLHVPLLDTYRQD